jgi:hypothetical protein
MADRYLWHVTVTTGHSRKSYRSEIQPQAIQVCRDLLEQMKDGARVAIPGVSGYFVSGRLTGKCASFSVYAGGTLLLSFAVAENERCGQALWKGLHNVEGLATQTDPEKQPRAPWLGVALAEGIALYPQAAGFLGDFERCIGWALLESLELMQNNPSPSSF